MSTYSDPPDRLRAVTPSDSTDLTGTRALFVGGAGSVAVRMIGDPTTTVTLTGVTAGQMLPLRVTRVMAATTATNITALL